MMRSLFSTRSVLIGWLVSIFILALSSIDPGPSSRFHLPFMTPSVDSRDTISVAPYIHGHTPVASLGKIENSDNAYINLKFRFRADNTDGNPNVFQTAPLNRGVRMEISGTTAVIIVPDIPESA